MGITAFQLIIASTSVWFHVLLSSYFQPGGIKINWMLLILIAFGLRYNPRWLPFLAALLGMFCDALSHGMIGAYGISFMLTILLAQWISGWFYTTTVFFTSLAFFALSLVEGTFGLFMLTFLESNLYLRESWFNRILPASILQGIAGPLVLWGIIRLDAFMIKTSE